MKYEYKCVELEEISSGDVHRRGSKADEYATRKINEQEEQGWELFLINTGNGLYDYCYFRRKIKA